MLEDAFSFVKEHTQKKSPAYPSSKQAIFFCVILVICQLHIHTAVNLDNLTADIA